MILVENKYSTSQVARIIGVHPNTVRLYEDLGLISKPLRKPNGYRVFSDIHIDEFRLARIAFHIEVLQSGLRKRMIEVVKLSAKGDYQKAIDSAYAYIRTTEIEISNANEAAEITNALLQNAIQVDELKMKRRDVLELLGLTVDTVRSWEMNGLVRIKHKENGYRVCDFEDINKLKIIRTLRCANYSLSSILRMMNAISLDEKIDTKRILNMPNEKEDIISVCDRLIVSLSAAKENAETIIAMLNEIKEKYQNPPL